MSGYAPRPGDYAGRGTWNRPGLITPASGGTDYLSDGIGEARQAARDAHLAALDAHEAALSAQIATGVAAILAIAALVLAALGLAS